MKGMWTFFQTSFVFLCTVAVAFADEAAKESGYNATYYIWYALIVIILVWGVYDSFFRPID